MQELIKKICLMNGIVCNKIEKVNSGFTNITHIIDDKYVIKITSPTSKPEKLQKEIEFYKNIRLDFIPKYITSGNHDGIDYLIISKLNGYSLFDIWHTLTNTQRNNCIFQIANILNKFHKLDAKFLDSKFKITNWVEKWQNSFDLNINILNKKGFDTSYIKNFKDEKLEQIFTENKPCLIYNDAHFDNFIFDNGKIYLIDFDRVLYCSIDYEILIIKMMLDAPQKFANEHAEQYVKIEDYNMIYPILKQLCKEMFDFKYINDRIFVYQFIYSLGQAYEYNHNNKILNLLNDFKEYFKY